MIYEMNLTDISTALNKHVNKYVNLSWFFVDTFSGRTKVLQFYGLLFAFIEN